MIGSLIHSRFQSIEDFENYSDHRCLLLAVCILKLTWDENYVLLLLEGLKTSREKFLFRRHHQALRGGVVHWRRCRSSSGSLHFRSFDLTRFFFDVNRTPVGSFEKKSGLYR